MVQETGWICPKCGQFNALTHVCAGCGMRPGRVPEATEPLQQRVHEDKIARVLNLIAHPPNFGIRPIGVTLREILTRGLMVVLYILTLARNATFLLIKPRFGSQLLPPGYGFRSNFPVVNRWISDR